MKERVCADECDLSLWLYFWPLLAHFIWSALKSSPRSHHLLNKYEILLPVSPHIDCAKRLVEHDEKRQEGYAEWKMFCWIHYILAAGMNVSWGFTDSDDVSNILIWSNKTGTSQQPEIVALLLEFDVSSLGHLTVHIRRYQSPSLTMIKKISWKSVQLRNPSDKQTNGQEWKCLLGRSFHLITLYAE